MAKYRKKPIIIEAIQFTGDNIEELEEFLDCDYEWYARNGKITHLKIETLEGDHFATVGDWIIKGVKEEFYPCKPDIFQITYEKVSD